MIHSFKMEATRKVEVKPVYFYTTSVNLSTIAQHIQYTDYNDNSWRLNNTIFLQSESYFSQMTISSTVASELKSVLFDASRWLLLKLEMDLTVNVALKTKCII